MRRSLAQLFAAACTLLMLVTLIHNTVITDTARPKPQGGMDVLAVTAVSLGKADAFLLDNGEQTMLIDTGYDDTAGDLLAVLEEHGVTELDVLLLSHYDKDHVGGADHVLNALPAARLIGPAYEKDSKQYNAFVEAADARGLDLEQPRQPVSFEFGSSTVTVYPPLRSEYEEENDFSLAVVVQHGTNSFLFTGDAEAIRLDELMAQVPLNCTWLKVPHHGKSSDNTTAFLHTVLPQYALIPCDHGGPDRSVQRTLAELGARVYRTSEGTYTFFSNGADPLTVATAG